MAEVPTLLIGLGGIGSHVVDTVYGWIPPERRAHIAVHAFDTNINDIGRLQHLKGRVTQTSEGWTVGQYLHRAGPLVKEWFPHEQPELLRKLLTEGAGQIRAVSRLAYRASMETGHLHVLERQIASIFQARGEAEVSSVRIMIVSSLAGGTGAGIFLQTAMYLRELLERTFARQNVLVRGAFLLPDVLIVPRVLDENEWENVRANGYASLKELNAITLNASGAGGQQQVTIEMEYRPDQTDAYGRQSLAITPRQLPYDFAFLYDFENTAGENLGQLGNYFEQVAQTVYLQLFTPIAGSTFSQEDNQILSLISNQGRSRYCGAGVSRLIYPYEEMVEYGALRWATDALSQQWLRLDEDFESEYRQYERDLQAGVSRVEPKLAERYIWLLDNYASGDRPEPFLREVFGSTRLLDEKGRPAESKHSLFLAAVEEEIERVLREDSDLAQAEAQCRVDEGRVRDKDRVRHEVIRVEDALLTLEQVVLKAVSEYRGFLFNQIILQDCDSPSGMQGQDYRLNTWLLGRSEALHPVAVRYVLYQLLLELEGRTRELGVRNADTLASIRRYARTFDLPETEDSVETAEDRVRQALDQSFFRSLLRSEVREFQDEYLDKSQRQLRALSQYKRDRLTELVMNAVREAVRTMLDEWERYFRNLRETRNHLLAEANRLAEAHDGGSDPTRQFVLAGRKQKERLWDDVRIGLTGRTIPVEISRQIYLGHYRRFCEVHHGGRSAEQRPERTEALFRQDVVEWCRKSIREQDALDLNVVQALRKEAEFAGDEDHETYITRRVEQLSRLARPLVPEVSGAAELPFWGMHPDSVRVLQDAHRDSILGTQLIEDQAFSRYQVLRYRATYGLKVEDFPKFSSGDPETGQPAGSYFTAYSSRILRLTNEGNTVTPHLDKRWHLQAFMPDLNPRKVEEEEHKVDRVWLYGLIFGYLQVVEEDGREVWAYNRESGLSLVVVDGATTPKHLSRLHKALLHNPAIVEQTLRRAEEVIADDRDKNTDEVERQRFHAGLHSPPGMKESMNILDVVLSFPKGGSAEPRIIEKRDALLGVLLNEITSFFRDLYGSHRSKTAGDLAAALIDQLRKESEVYRKADAGSRDLQTWKNLIDGHIRKLRQA
jgi:hypothetical protein